MMEHNNWLVILCLFLLVAGCAVDRHHGHMYLHEPNHIEVVFDRPMSMEFEQGDVKVKASSMKPGFFEDILKFMLLGPRN